MLRLAANFSLLAALGAMLFEVASSQAPGPSPSPIESLRKALNADLHSNYSAIKQVSVWGSDRSGVRVRKDQAASGKSATFVLSPTTMQGRITVDDGKLWSTYNPDNKTLYVQESPGKVLDRAELDRRMLLIQQNYKVTSGRPQTIAGRRTLCVQIEPEAKDPLFKRAFWIDAEQNVILRVVWTHPNGAKRVIVDTESISFPEKIDDEVFKIKLLENPKQVRIQSPRMERTISSLSKHVGFSVRLPVEIPMGFLFTRAEAVTGPSRTMAALRYTDGAANVTVYQSPAVGGRPPWRMDESRGDFEQEGSFFAVDGDIPDEARAKIISAVKESSKTYEDQLRARAAKQLDSSEKLVAELRDLGLKYSYVVASIYCGKRSAKDALFAAWGFRKGKTLGEMAQKYNLRESEVRKVVNTFWTNK